MNFIFIDNSWRWGEENLTQRQARERREAGAVAGGKPEEDFDLDELLGDETSHVPEAPSTSTPGGDSDHMIH